ncbi:MAG: cation transporter [Candidatus Zixiibacteriota bacterium]|nr:MAG: cation transporter [candidate division Zixibacteria bacterium]
MAHHNATTTVSGKKLTWTIIFNAVITLAEFVGGMLTGYLALVADAVHNLSDVAALGLAWLGHKGSQMPATKRSTYGYKRVEVMTAFISAVALVVIAIFILMEAYDRLIDPTPITMPWLFLSVAAIGLAGNIVSILLLRTEKGKSLNMKTAFLHMAYDALSSVAVLAGGVVIMLTDLYLIDTILSSIIAVMIFWSSYLVIREAVLIFMEVAPAAIDFDDVFRAIRNTPKVEDVHDLHIWSLSSNDIALSCHICVEEEHFQDGPAVVMSLNQMLRETFKIGHSTIQVEKTDFRRPDALCTRDGHGED